MKQCCCCYYVQFILVFIIHSNISSTSSLLKTIVNFNTYLYQKSLNSIEIIAKIEFLQIHIISSELKQDDKLFHDVRPIPTVKVNKCTLFLYFSVIFKLLIYVLFLTKRKAVEVYLYYYINCNLCVIKLRNHSI